MWDGMWDRSVTNKGRHPQKALSAARVRSLSEPGRYADGNGLYLVVDRSGAKRWILRTVVQGRRRDIGLGSASLVPLAEARESAVKLRRVARDGGDPITERRKSRLVVPTFEDAANKVHAEHSPSWKNAKHAAQWINTLKTYAFPKIGDLPVNGIGTPQVLDVLAPIWLTKPETARRLRQRIGTVLDWAKVAGFRTGDNPIAGISKGLPKQPAQKTHHAALPYSEIPDFIKHLRGANASQSSLLAFEFLILTATRTSEVILAEWSEFDLEKKEWVIPGQRMKAHREFRVPLSQRCLEILDRAKTISDGGAYVFSGRSLEKPLSNTTFLMIVRRMGKAITPHGFRSTFRDWASERTNFPREVCEMALAHSVSDKTEAAYLRGDLFDKRRELMQTWNAFATSDPGADIVPIRVSQ